MWHVPLQPQICSLIHFHEEDVEVSGHLVAFHKLINRVPRCGDRDGREAYKGALRLKTRP